MIIGFTYHSWNVFILIQGISFSHASTDSTTRNMSFLVKKFTVIPQRSAGPPEQCKCVQLHTKRDCYCDYPTAA